MLIRILQPASYGKKNGMWYASPGNQGWGAKSLSRKASVVEADVAPPAATSTLKPSAGRVIRIINHLDHSVQVSDYELFYMHIIASISRSEILHRIVDSGYLIYHEIATFKPTHDICAFVHTLYLYMMVSGERCKTTSILDQKSIRITYLCMNTNTPNSHMRFRKEAMIWRASFLH